MWYGLSCHYMTPLSRRDSSVTTWLLCHDMAPLSRHDSSVTTCLLCHDMTPLSRHDSSVTTWFMCQDERFLTQHPLAYFGGVFFKSRVVLLLHLWNLVHSMHSMKQSTLQSVNVLSQNKMILISFFVINTSRNAYHFDPSIVYVSRRASPTPRGRGLLWGGGSTLAASARWKKHQDVVPGGHLEWWGSSSVTEGVEEWGPHSFLRAAVVFDGFAIVPCQCFHAVICQLPTNDLQWEVAEPSSFQRECAALLP